MCDNALANKAKITKGKKMKEGTMTVEQIQAFIKENPEFKYEVIKGLKGGSRGRPALPDHVKAEREAAKLLAPKGKRGRPVNAESLKKQIEIAQAKLAAFESQV